MSDLIERKSIRNLYSCLNPNDRVLVGQVLIDIDAISSAEVPTTMTGVVDAIREAEYRGYMKGVLVGGEERPKGEWADALAELHERFNALEKEIRRASAEMSAIIREYVDEPKDEPQTEIEWWDCIDHRDMEHHVYCTPKIDESRYEPQTETDKDLKEVRIAVARAKAFKTSDIDEPPTKCDLCKREGDDACVDCERKKQSGKE